MCRVRIISYFVPSCEPLPQHRKKLLLTKDTVERLLDSLILKLNE